MNVFHFFSLCVFTLFLYFCWSERGGGGGGERGTQISDQPTSTLSPLTPSPASVQSDRRPALPGSLLTTRYHRPGLKPGPSPRLIHGRSRRGSGRSHKTGPNPRAEGRQAGRQEHGRYGTEDGWAVHALEPKRTFPPTGTERGLAECNASRLAKVSQLISSSGIQESDCDLY